MARTYHDAPITAAQMDKVLSSLNSVSKASNNGKILCVDDFGFLTAKTQQELHIGAVLEPVTISENGTVTPPEGVDGFDSVTVDVSEPAPVLQNKIVTQNGVVTPDTGYDGLGQVTVDVPGGGYPEPTGTIPITANGTVNVKDYESAEVNVPNSYSAADEGKIVSNGALVAQTARATEITANGTYDTTENNSVTVNVSGGGGSGVITGTTDPTSSQGNNGDVYLKIASSTLDKLEYIENTASAWIQTGYVPKNNSKFELDGIFPAPSNSYDTPFGTRGGSDNFVAYNGGTYRYVFGNKSGNVGSMASYYGQDATMVLSALGCSLVVNGVTVLESSFSASGVSSNGMGLFTLATGATSRMGSCDSKFKLKEFRIYENDAIVHQYIPSIDSNNTVGLTDIIESVFWGPVSGSGSFVSGPQQGEIIITSVVSVYYKVNGVWEKVPGAISMS